MSTIDEIAADVANSVVSELAIYDKYPELKSALIETANLSASRMAVRLAKTVDADRFFQLASELQSKSYGSAQTNNQIFIGIGYASLIAVWSSIASDISHFARMLAGFCLIFSSAIFVCWTVVGMFVTQKTLMRSSDALLGGPIDFLSRNAEAEQENLKTLNRVQRFWKPVVIAAGLPALIAAITLASSSAQNIFANAKASNVRFKNEAVSSKEGLKTLPPRPSAQ